MFCLLLSGTFGDNFNYNLLRIYIAQNVQKISECRKPCVLGASEMIALIFFRLFSPYFQVFLETTLEIP